MELNKNNKHVIDAVFILMLMMLFIMSSLAVIAIGASIYQKNVAKMQDNYSHRIVHAYVTEKIRQSDNRGRVFVDTIFEQNALILQDEINGTLYNTYIYDYNGYLMELFARADLSVLYPESGQKITPVNSFDINEISDNLLMASFILEDGRDETVYISKRTTDER